jgi:hypothetical protein
MKSVQKRMKLNATITQNVNNIFLMFLGERTNVKYPKSRLWIAFLGPAWLSLSLSFFSLLTIKKSLCADLSRVAKCFWVMMWHFFYWAFILHWVFNLFISDQDMMKFTRSFSLSSFTFKKQLFFSFVQTDQLGNLAAKKTSLEWRKLDESEEQ